MARNKKKAEVKDIRKYAEATNHDLEIIIRPLITEKTMRLTQEQNKITVVVAKHANAIEVKNAFEAIFNVKVEKVNIANVRPHHKRVGMHSGLVSGYKKAIVKLAAGEALDLFKETQA